MKLELLSPNLIEMIDSCLDNQSIARLLYYDINPLSRPEDQDVSRSLIAPFGAEERLLPYPFDHTFNDEQVSQLHIYYPDLTFKNNEHVEQSVVWFDIIVHKKLWLYKDNGKRLIRPYEIASQLARTFDGSIPRPKSTVGILNFKAMAHVTVNNQFDGLRLEAKMTTFNE